MKCLEDQDADQPLESRGNVIRHDSETAVPLLMRGAFGCLLFGTIVIVGALLFLPVAALGPVAEHLGPIPFGG